MERLLFKISRYTFRNISLCPPRRMEHRKDWTRRDAQCLSSEHWMCWREGAGQRRPQGEELCERTRVGNIIRRHAFIFSAQSQPKASVGMCVGLALVCMTCHPLEAKTRKAAVWTEWGEGQTFSWRSHVVGNYLLMHFLITINLDCQQNSTDKSFSFMRLLCRTLQIMCWNGKLQLNLALCDITNKLDDMGLLFFSYFSGDRQAAKWENMEIN